MKKGLLSIATAALLLTAAHAGESTFEIGAHANKNYTDNDSPIKDHFDSYGLRANYRLLDDLLVGLEYNYANDAKFKAGGATDLQSFFLNAQYEILDNDSYTPYAIAGIGYQDVDNEISNVLESGMLAQIGAGWKFHLIEMLDLFVEGKYIRDIENEFDNFALTAGLSIPFGVMPKKPEAPKVVDSDGDGVEDSKDMCPNTPAGIKVDASGCPLDDDNDGVPNYKDKCPDTPAGVKVDENGCKLVQDSDGDGVIDSLDKCPNTPKGVAVDKHGCPIIINLNINFDFDSAEIKPEFLPKIKEVVEFLKANPAYKAEIQGHTDSIGSAAYNKKLSEKRAKAVYEVMVKMGIDPSRLTYVGYGEERPIADNSTSEGRAKNRRVEVHLYY